MNGTPRLRSAFPATPPHNSKSPKQDATPSERSVTQRIPDIKALQPPKSDPNPPLIPFDTIDAPSQRLYIAGIYAALIFWRLYDFYHLTVDETESLWQFMKWVSIDGVFLFGLPGLRIPWLEWSSATMTILFLIHAFLDGILMFRIPIPLGSGLVAITKLLYDREIAVSERRVKPGDILHNPSLILGRQIINILPEGSATLNPNKDPLCISDTQPSVFLPLRINQTNPISIELIRFDLETSKNESILINSSQVRKLRREAEKIDKAVSRDPSNPLLLHYPVKKTGLYRLHRVVDETKLEVQMRSNEALVVSCPSARWKTTSRNRCIDDLSDLVLEVRGTPPLQVKYRKTINGKGDEKAVSYQSIYPEDFISPLMNQKHTDALVFPDHPDMTWATPHIINVPLNETLASSGAWYYSIEQVKDACNNFLNYTEQYDEDSETPRAKERHIEELLLVHDRPRVSFDAHTIRKTLVMPKGGHVNLPLTYPYTAKSGVRDTQHDLEISFTPHEGTRDNGPDDTHESSVNTSVKNTNEQIQIANAGIYTLRSVSTPFCKGEVLEPVSCVVVSPDPPTLITTSEPIEDKCAGNPIGLRVNFDLTGTPPFKVKYSIQKNRETPRVETKRIEGLRSQLELKPGSAGQYTYTIIDVEDALYPAQSLKGIPNTVLQQRVKPSVFAYFMDNHQRKDACLNGASSAEVRFEGERPWALEYEIIHNGKRKKHTISNVTDDSIQVEAGPFTSGGMHTIALVSVADSSGCKETLKDEFKVNVRHELPRAGFGTVEGKRHIQALERKSIHVPLRLSGEGPWFVEYLVPGRSEAKAERILNPNDKVSFKEPGEYQIIAIRDRHCVGTVDPPTSTFHISWIDRPSIHIGSSELMQETSGAFTRKEICEGDRDSVDVAFAGKPPFDVKYQETCKPIQGSKVVRPVPMHIPQQAVKIEMNTAQAGECEYSFVELGDSNYDLHRYGHISIHQRVNPRPSAVFSYPGKVYSFCQGQESGLNEEVIPIKLTGKAPFTLELELKHHSKSSKPQMITIPNIVSDTYSLHLSHSNLQPGNSALTIRRIRDDHGCERFIEPLASPRVQISVHDLPSIVASEERAHYCVGERISYTLTGQAPYTVFYTFGGREQKAPESSATFRRIAETPGNWTITGISDAASQCKRTTSITKQIHPMPSVRVSKGKESRVDIHAGSETEILFEFGGEPPFEFTYTRSENTKRGDRRHHGHILETKTLMSEEKVLKLKAGDEGTYEVVAIRDRYCSFSMQTGAGEWASERSQGLLQQA